MVNNWLSIPKLGLNARLSQLFHGKQDRTTAFIYEFWERHYIALTEKQKTAELFMMCSFLLTAAIWPGSNYAKEIKSISTETEGIELLSSLLNSLFNRGDQ